MPINYYLCERNSFTYYIINFAKDFIKIQRAKENVKREGSEQAEESGRPIPIDRSMGFESEILRESRSGPNNWCGVLFRGKKGLL